MTPALPDLIVIDHDEHHADLIGSLPDGRQFFITTPFVAAWPQGAGREFVALYLFGARGQLLEARIDDFDLRASMDLEARTARVLEHLKGLGEYQFGRIEIAPFRLERFGMEFGLISNPMDDPDDEDEALSISLMPGDYMAFFEPWDDGEYDT